MEHLRISTNRIVKYESDWRGAGDRRISVRQVAKKTQESIVNVVRIVEDGAETRLVKKS
jgi:hypothetical protein